MRESTAQPEAPPEPEPEPEDEKTIEELMEERRRKRAAILARHASGQSSVAASAPPLTPSGVVGEGVARISIKDGSVPPTGEFILGLTRILG